MRNRSAWGDEEGATAALVALSLMTLLTVALVAIDGGSMLHTRRGLVADTDAAALATASELLEDPCASESIALDHAEEMAVLNSVDTTVLDVTLDRGGDCTQRYGYVEVATAHPVALFFAPIFGVDAWDATAATTAGYGRIQALDDLRPIGICGADPHYAEWAQMMTVLRSPPETDDAAAAALYEANRVVDPADHPSYAGAGVVHRMRFQRLNEEQGPCASLGTPGGNWGWLDLDGGGNRNSDLVDWLENGYPGTVDLGAPGSPADCVEPEAGTEDCPGDPGGGGNSTDRGRQGGALTSITCGVGLSAGEDGCPIIYVIVYDSMTTGTGGQGGGGQGGGGQGGGGQGGGGQGGGANVEFHPVSFAGITLRGHNIGTGQTTPEESWIDIEFVDERLSGRIGPAPPVDSYPGPLGVELCGTEHFDACP